MGDISIISRRLSDGHVQHGWSGNGGYFSSLGTKLLAWYQQPEDVEYLFGLGQTACVGKRGTENLGMSIFGTNNAPTGRPFWLHESERWIFSEIAFIDYGYFYDLDKKWYYVIPGPFRIKMPLELVGNHLDENGYEMHFREDIADMVLKYIFGEYRDTYSDFNAFIENGKYDMETVYKDIDAYGKLSMYKLFEKHHQIFAYFDDWVLIKTDDAYRDITEIIVKKKEEKHIETCEW